MRKIVTPFAPLAVLLLGACASSMSNMNDLPRDEDVVKTYSTGFKTTAIATKDAILANDFGIRQQQRFTPNSYRFIAEKAGLMIGGQFIRVQVERLGPNQTSVRVATRRRKPGDWLSKGDYSEEIFEAIENRLKLGAPTVAKKGEGDGWDSGKRSPSSISYNELPFMKIHLIGGLPNFHKISSNRSTGSNSFASSTSFFKSGAFIGTEIDFMLTENFSIGPGIATFSAEGDSPKPVLLYAVPRIHWPITQSTLFWLGLGLGISKETSESSGPMFFILKPGLGVDFRLGETFFAGLGFAAYFQKISLTFSSTNPTVPSSEVDGWWTSLGGELRAGVQF